MCSCTVPTYIRRHTPPTILGTLRGSDPAPTIASKASIIIPVLQPKVRDRAGQDRAASTVAQSQTDGLQSTCHSVNKATD